MPGKVNSYVKQRAMAVREMNGGVTPQLTVPVAPAGSGMPPWGFARWILQKVFFLSVSKHLLFINHRCSAWYFMGQQGKHFLPRGAHAGCCGCHGHARGRAEVQTGQLSVCSPRPPCAHLPTRASREQPKQTEAAAAASWAAGISILLMQSLHLR